MRPIDGAKLEEILEKWLKECEFSEPDGNVEAQAVYACICELHNMPTLDVAPVVHGRWEKWNGDDRHHCTACECYANEERDAYGYITSEFLDNYCPNCGAKMDV